MLFVLRPVFFFGGFLACPNKKTSKVKVCLDKTNGHSCPGIVCRPANVWSPVVEIDEFEVLSYSTAPANEMAAF